MIIYDFHGIVDVSTDILSLSGCTFWGGGGGGAVLNFSYIKFGAVSTILFSRNNNNFIYPDKSDQLIKRSAGINR